MSTYTCEGSSYCTSTVRYIANKWITASESDTYCTGDIVGISVGTENVVLLSSLKRFRISFQGAPQKELLYLWLVERGINNRDCTLEQYATKGAFTATCFAPYAFTMPQKAIVISILKPIKRNVGFMWVSVSQADIFTCRRLCIWHVREPTNYDLKSIKWESAPPTQQ